MKSNDDSQKHPIHTGTSLDDFLKEEHIRSEVDANAMQRVREWKTKQESE